MKVITRFAPSPTGFLHIGGARTALFNYLFSQHYNGKFLLRIEDTDKKRSTKEAIDAIINGLSWLNINWHDKIIMQSQNINSHQIAAYHLLEIGKAYHCYCLPKNSTSQNNTPCNCINLKLKIKPDISPAIRLKVNKEGISCIDDLVAGQITTPKKDIEDFIILRGDKTPTYLLASVIDDINMNITHVIRGNDHLSNTFKQKEIFESLKKPLPEFAHIPLIHGYDGSKLSKRHGALGIEEYKNMGYLNQAINNYLMKLGWSLNNQDIITIKEAIKNFNIKDVQKSAARFDFNKLNSINAHYIKQQNIDELINLLNPFIQDIIIGKELLPNYKTNFKKLLPFLQTRFKTLKDIAINSVFILIKNIEISPEALDILKLNINMLKEQKSLLENTDSFNREELHQIIKSYTKNNNISLGKGVTSLRASLCGETNSPASVFDIMTILGKKEALYRITKAINIIA